MEKWLKLKLKMDYTLHLPLTEIMDGKRTLTVNLTHIKEQCWDIGGCSDKSLVQTKKHPARTSSFRLLLYLCLSQHKKIRLTVPFGLF